MRYKIHVILAQIVVNLLFSLTNVSAPDWANFDKYADANATLENPGRMNNRVVLMGNSITEKWPLYDSTFFAGKPYINRGISGQVSSQMLLRFRNDVIELQPRIVVISAGTNDIAENQGKITLSQIAANIFSMAELAEANDIEVILTSVLPANSYKWRPEIYPADKIIELNEMIKAYAKDHDLMYVNYYKRMVNKEKGLKKEYGRDSVHPSTEGYKVMGPLLEKAIAKTIKRSQKK